MCIDVTIILEVDRVIIYLIVDNQYSKVQYHKGTDQHNKAEQCFNEVDNCIHRLLFIFRFSRRIQLRAPIYTIVEAET